MAASGSWFSPVWVSLLMRSSRRRRLASSKRARKAAAKWFCNDREMVLAAASAEGTVVMAMAF